MRSAYTAYFEEEILSASPLRLVCLLYSKALSELRNARTALASGKISDRSAAISKACDVLAELVSSLDFQNGGDTAVRLGELYRYSIARLLHANLHKEDAPLAEVLSLLVTLQEGWEAISTQAAAPAVSMPDAAVYAPQSESIGQSWSF